MKIKDARKRSKYKAGGSVIHRKTKYSEKDDTFTTNVVFKSPTPTKDKPGDTRLYRGKSTLDSKHDTEVSAKRFAEHKAYPTPKKKPKKRKRLFKRRK